MPPKWPGRPACRSVCGLEEVVACRHLDDFAAGERLLQRLTLCGTPHRQAMLLWTRGRQHLVLGRLDDALADFVAMGRLEDDVEVPVHQVHTRVLRSRIALLRGDRAEAERNLATARAGMAARPSPGIVAVVRCPEAAHADADGDAGLAADRVRQAQRYGPLIRRRLLRTWMAEAVRIA
ncbi:hypothetical protein QFZ32_000532 [Streptomyces canus]|nr:hypothetical protein [Streptomyces canus]MDQ1065093.1 hypothetical protein [Streptomyces canus]